MQKSVAIMENLEDLVMCDISTPERLLIGIKYRHFRFLHFLSIQHQDTENNNGHHKLSSSPPLSQQHIIINIINSSSLIIITLSLLVIIMVGEPLCMACNVNSMSSSPGLCVKT